MVRTNATDIKGLMDDFLLSMPCRIQKPYPSAIMPVRDKDTAELLSNAFANGGNAEFTAVAQYIHHAMTLKVPDLSNLLWCIALVEMKHLEMIGQMIESLGGDLKFWRTNRAYWSGGNVNYGNTVCEKLSLDLYAEEEAISGYTALLRAIEIPQVRTVIERILEDEQYHRELFTYALDQYCTSPLPDETR